MKPVSPWPYQDNALDTTTCFLYTWVWVNKEINHFQNYYRITLVMFPAVRSDLMVFRILAFALQGRIILQFGRIGEAS